MIEELRKACGNRDFFTATSLRLLIGGSRDRVQSWLKRAVQQGKIIRLKRGLYCFSFEYRRQPLDLFVLAPLIYGPSYLSLESALSYHGWIPEQVTAVTSVCSRRSCEFKTPLGIFAYEKIIAHPLLIGVERIRTPGGSFLLAKPEKAILDYVYCRKKDWIGIDPLVLGLRVDPERLEGLSLSNWESLASVYHSGRVSNFVKSLRGKR